MQTLARRCVEGITADPDRCRSYLDRNPAMATLLNPLIGYLKAAEVAKEALARGRPVQETALAMGVISPEDAERVFDPAVLLGEAPPS
jgi:fumarate hydratase class II